MPESSLVLSGNLAFVNLQENQTPTRTLTIVNTGNSTLTIPALAYTPLDSVAMGPGTHCSRRQARGHRGLPPTANHSYTGMITVNANHTTGTNTINWTSDATLVSIFQHYDKAYNAWCVTGADFLYDEYYPFVYSANLESWWYIFDMANNGTEDSCFLYNFKTEHFSYTSGSFDPYYF